MSRLTLVMAAAVIGVSPAAAEEIPWANKFFENPPPPVIVHDFGTVPKGTLLRHSFPITNIYAVPMQITEIRKSCGCVEAVASKQVLESNEVGSIDLTMDASKFDGEKVVTIYVTLGPKFVSTAVLQVKATSRGDVLLTPGQVDFGVVAQGQEAVQQLDVTYTGLHDWRLTGVVDTGVPYDVRVQELQRQRGQIIYRLFISLKKDAPAGALADELVLQTNDPASPQLSIRTSGRIQAPLAVSPSVVQFDAVSIGSTARYNVLIRGTQAFRITKVEGLGEGLKVNLPPASQLVQIVTIEFQPTEAGSLRRELRFVTDLEGEVAPTVIVEAEAR